MTERTIFLAALDIDDPAERAAYVDRACGDNAGLRAQVEGLLNAHEQPAGFMARPAPALVTIDHPAAEEPGTVIGPYKLLEQIGEGGFGVVYMAEQTAPVRRKVALKLLKPGMDTRQVVARFEAERQALAIMDHPNIARVFDGGMTPSGRPYFVMELVKGVPITEFCDRNHLAPRQRLELFVSVCQAVQHAHQKGIIHRDLKPSNILVTVHDTTPVVKVIDFGVAKALGQELTDKTLFTGFAQMIGTPLYMSPEQAGQSGLDIDTRSDIYSLGVLLYELLTGTTPFTAERFKKAAYDEIRRIIREEEPPRPSTRLSESKDSLPSVAAQRHTEPAKLTRLVRGELDWVVMKALEKDRNRRYETANGFASDVQRYLSGEAVQAVPQSAGYRVRKSARRNQAALLTASLLAAALLLGTVVSTWQALRARQAESLAQSRLEAEKEARDRAVSEAARANAVSAVLEEALRSANPGSIKGADYTVRQLLDDLARGLGDRLKDQPEAEAAVRSTLGQAYTSVGRPQDAEPHLRRALDLRRAVLGPDHPDTVKSLLDHSYNAACFGNPAAAEAEAREALAICLRANNPGHTLTAFGLLAADLAQQRKWAESRDVADRALAFARSAGCEEHPEVAKILHNQVDARIGAGDGAGAEQLARDALAIHRRVNGPDHPETGWSLYKLGLALNYQGKFVEAEKALRGALTIFRKHSNEVSILFVSGQLQEVLRAQGDEAGAAELRADDVARLARAVELHRADAGLRMRLGDLLRNGGDLDRAITQYSEVIARDPGFADAWVARGDCHSRMRAYPKAVEDFTAAVKLKPDHSEVWTGRAWAYLNLQEWAKAAADYTEAIRLAPKVHTNWFHRGHAYLKLEAWDKAAADFTTVVEGWPDAPDGWYLRAIAHAQMKQPDQALADLRQAVAKGFKELERLRGETRFAPLHSSEEFQRLLRELEKQMEKE
jgi:serine/threonine protein kinase/Tfp pilus assembly protein PilF